MPFIIQLEATNPDNGDLLITYVSRGYFNGYPACIPGKPGQRPAFWKTGNGATGALYRRAPSFAFDRGLDKSDATLLDWLNFIGGHQYTGKALEVDHDFIIPGEVLPQLQELQAIKLVRRLKADIRRLQLQRQRIEQQINAKQEKLVIAEQEVERERISKIRTIDAIA
jgi:hypothetical protein